MAALTDPLALALSCLDPKVTLFSGPGQNKVAYSIIQKRTKSLYSTMHSTSIPPLSSFLRNTGWAVRMAAQVLNSIAQGMRQSVSNE